ncbi:MAG TPA: hypothetical protein VL947_00330, partial [Cytophagales bacterium]|nr:hypothetical protein [Cytophagales bacterium]
MGNNDAHRTLGKKILRIVGKIMLSLLVLLLVIFVALWLLLKVPKVQTYLVHKATHYVSDKTKTRVELTSIDIGFPKYIILNGLFLEDQQHDTLAYAQRISVDIDMLALIDKKIGIDDLELSHVQGRLKRSKVTQQFNFQFLIDAFASKDKDTLAVKDTTGSVWEIDANEISLSHCKFDFEDSVGGMFVHTFIGDIDVNIDDLDLKDKDIVIDEVALKDIDVDIVKTMPAPPDTSSDGGGWSKIKINTLEVAQVRFEYKDQHLNTRYFSQVGSSKLENAKVDLLAQTIALDEFVLANSISEILLYKDTLPTPKVVKEQLEPKKGWTVSAERIKLDNNQFSMDNQLPRLQNGIDYNHLALKGLSFDIEDIYYQGTKVMANIAEFKVQEQSGLGIRSFKGDFAMDSSSVKLKDFDLVTNLSRVQRSVEMSYSSLSEITTTGRFDCDLIKSKIAVQELLWLLPSLAKNEILVKNRQRTVEFECKAKGTIDKMDLGKLIVHTSRATHVSVSGSLQHVTKPERLYMDLDIKDLSSTHRDLSDLLPAKMLPTAIQLPDFVSIRGKHKGTLSDFVSDLALTSTHGNATVSAAINKLNSKQPQYHVKLQTSSFALGTLLKQPTLGSLTANVTAKGQGFDKDNAVADVNMY